MKAALCCLSTIILLCAAIAQEKKHSGPQWKEYAYPEDGFSITAPAAPNIHTDPEATDVKVYRWDLATDIPFAIHVGVRPNCKDILQQAKDEPPQESLIEIFLDGYRGIESHAANRKAQRNELERIYCVKEKAYSLSIQYPLKQTRPAVVDRVLNSFHLIEK